MQQLKYHYHPIAGLHPVCVHYHSHFAGHYLCLGIGVLYIHICLWHQVLSFYEYIGGCHCHRLVTTFPLTIYMCTIDNEAKSNVKEQLWYHVHKISIVLAQCNFTRMSLIRMGNFFQAYQKLIGTQTFFLKYRESFLKI